MPAARPRRSRGWRPQQHGAWFMLTLPVIVGLIERDAPWPVYLLPLALCWVLGYLAFNAASGWLKVPAARKPQYVPAVLTYSLACAGAGLVTLALAGPTILVWLAVFVPLVGVALALAAARKERTLLSGAATVAAAALMTLVTAGTPTTPRTLLLTAGVFGYLMGTVFYVKTMIRERGQSGWLAASVGWHAGCMLAASVAAAIGALGWVWPAFFGATVLRAWLLPAVARSRPVRPSVVGIVEICFSIGFVIATVVG